MTTIILSIVGILIASAASLMVVFYGGSTFMTGATNASANLLENGAVSVLSAVSVYKIDKGSSPTSIADLKTNNGAYLKDDPKLPAGASQSYSGTQYIVAGVAGDVCAALNENLKLTGVVTSTSSTSQKMLCIPTAATAGAPGIFYANA